MQLTIEGLKQVIDGLPNDMLVFLGDDAELNGVHRGVKALVVDTTDNTDPTDTSFAQLKTLVDGSGTNNKTVLLIL